MKYYQQWQGRAITDNGPSELFKADVPGNIQNDYARHIGLGDVNYSNNCIKYSEFEEYTWEYTTVLKFDRKPRERAFFVSEGIDYYSSVSFNGTELLKHEGMFSKIEIDITDFLNDTNELKVTVYPHPKRKNAFKGTRDEADIAVKPPVCYGWDWHPRLLVSGMWQEAYIETRDIENGYISEVSIKYRLNDELTAVEGNFDIECSSTAYVEIFDRDSNTVYSGDGSQFRIDDVKLWWCVGHGEPYLYHWRVSCGNNTKEGKIGFKRIELSMDSSEWGKPRYYPMSRSNPPTCIVLNGKKVFAKGSNFVTPEIFTGIVTKERYEELLDMVVDLNMNILRMWGGCGIQKDMFYDLCDEKGIMIWQEFPLACNRYAFHNAEHYNKILNSEAREIVKQLRKHACLTLLCGGNELFNNWSLMTEQSIPLRLLDAICLELCPEIPYIMTSPLSGMAHGPYNFYIENMGDVFQAFQQSEATAYTEFGLPTLSSPEFLESFLSEEELNNIEPGPDRPWSLHHALGAKTDADNVIYRSNFERYKLPHETLREMYESSTWLSCEGLKGIFEESRRQWPTCCMSLNWFFNEPWKVAFGRSLVLYPNQKKSNCEAVKNSLRPVLISARIPKFDWKKGECFKAELWLLNDSYNEVEDTVTATLSIGNEEYELAVWNTGKQTQNKLGPTVNLILPDSSAEFMVLKLTSEKGYDSEYKLRYYPSAKKKAETLREMNSTNDL